MALSGSLDDFNIMNILQMIKLEGKTGRLAITEGDDLIKITFDGGAIIYAEAQPAIDEVRIKESILSNGLLDPEIWESVQKEHEDRLRPYWELLSRRIEPKTLLELIRRQVIDNVYSALRWKYGQYEFSPMKNLKYNSKVMTPMDVDALLMEGCRVADEWPRLLKESPPFSTFVTKNILGENQEDATMTIKAEDIKGDTWNDSLEREVLKARGIALNKADITVLSVVNEGRTIQDVLYAARQGQFESLEAIQRLLQQKVLVVAEKKQIEKIVVEEAPSIFKPLVVVALLLALISGGAYWQLSNFQSLMELKDESVVKLKTIQGKSGLRKVLRGLKIYHTLHATAPESLSELVKTKILESSETLDPWGNEFVYLSGEGTFSLFSEGPDRFLTTDNVYIDGPPVKI